MDKATQPRSRNFFRIGIVVAAVLIALTLYTLFTGTEQIAIIAWVMFAAAIAIFVLSQFPKLSLRAKIIVITLALTLLPLAILALVNNRVFSDTLTARTASSLKNLAGTEARTISSLLESESNNLNVLSFDSALVAAVKEANGLYHGDADANRADLEKLDQEWRAADAANNDADPLVAARLNNPTADVLRKFRSAYPANVEVFVTDKFGGNVAATNRTSDYYQADEEWWQAAYNNGQGAIYLGQPSFDESSQTNAINLATPIFGADGHTVEGVLRTTFSVKALSTVLESVRPGETGHAHILLPNNRTIGYEQFGTHDSSTLMQLRDAQTDFVEIQAPGVAPRFYSIAPLEGAPASPAAAAVTNLKWIVLVHQNRAETLAPIEAQTRNVILLALLIGAVGAVIAFGGARVVTQPITRLTATAEQIRAGDLQARAPVESADEIGTLATTFNEMTAQLQESVGNLEQRVAERTAQQDANNAYYVLLQTISVALLKRRDLQELLQEIIARAGELVGTTNGYVFLLDPGTDEMVLRVGVGAYQEFVGTKAKSGVALAGKVWQTGEAVAVDDYRNWSGRLADPSRDLLRAVVGVPLKSGDTVIGIIGLAHLEPEKRFGPTEMDVLNRFAALASVALDNASLYQASQRELSERHRAERFLDSIVENIPAGIFIKDAKELRFVGWNKSNERLTGLSRAQVLNKNDYDLFPVEEAAFFQQTDRQVLTSKTLFDVPIEPIQTANRGMRFLHTQKVPILDENGEPLYLLGIMEDITDRKATQERADLQNAMLAAQYEVSPDGILVVGNDDRVLSYNHRFVEMWNIPEDALRAGSAEALRQAVREQVADVEEWLHRSGEIYMSQEKSSRDEVEFKDGRVFERYSAPVKTADGAYLGRVWFFHDVTETRRTEQDIRRVVQGTRAIFWRADVTALDDPTQEALGYSWVTRVSNPDAAMQYLPFEMAEGQTYEDALYFATLQEDRDSMDRTSAKTLRSGANGYTQEYRVIDANGVMHWMYEDARIRYLLDGKFEIVGVTTDVTERKRAEEAVRANQALYESLVETIPQALTRKDREGRLTFGNSRFFEDLNSKPEDIYGKTDFDFHPRELAEKYWQDDLRVLRDGESIDTIEKHQRGDGKEIIVHVVKTPLRTDANEIDGMQVMFWDITEDQRQQEQLRQQNAYLNALQETSLGMMQRLDANSLLHDIVARAGALVGTDNGYVFLINPAAGVMELRVGVGAYEGFLGRVTKRGEGLAGQVWETNAPIVVDDYRNWGGRIADPSRDILRAVAGVPLRSGNEVIGVIGLAYLDESKKFGDAEIQVLERFAQLTTISLDNVQLYEAAQEQLFERTNAEAQLAKQLRETELLNQVTGHAVSLEADKALGQICRDFAEFFGVAHVEIALLNQARTILTVVAEHSPQGTPTFVGYEIPVAGNSSVESLMRTRLPSAYSRAQQDVRLASLREFMRARGIVSTLIAPLLVRDQVLGTLGIDSTELRDFTDDELRLVERVQVAISSALENTRLYQQAQTSLAGEQQQRRLADALADAASKLSSTLDEAEIRRVVLDEINTLLKPDQITLYEGSKQAQGLRLERRPVSDPELAFDDYRINTEISAETRADLWQSFAEAKSLYETTDTSDGYLREHFCLPWFAGDNAEGVIEIYHTARFVAIRPTEQQTCQGIVRQASIAIQNARLFLQTEQEVAERTRAEAALAHQLRETELLNRVTTHAVSMDVDKALTAICRDLAEYFVVKQAGVALLSPDRQSLTVVAEYSPQGAPDVIGYVIPVQGNPSTEIVMATRQAVAFVEAQSDPRLAAVHDLMRTRKTASIMIAPLFARDEIFGTLGIDSEERREFTEGDVSLVQRVAVSISTALENARLYRAAQQEIAERTRAEKETSQRNKELEAISRVSSVLTTNIDMQTALETMARELVQTFKARNCGIALLNPDGQSLTVVADALTEGHDEHAVGIVIPVENNPSTQYVLTNRRPLIIPDAQTDPMTAPIHERMIQRHTKCLAIIPLLSGGQVIGTIGLDTTDPDHLFSDEEIRLAETMANQMANAIEKQRLFDQTKERARREQLTREIGADLSRSLDMETIVQTMARELSHALGASHAVVRMGATEKESNGGNGHS